MSEKRTIFRIVSGLNLAVLFTIALIIHEVGPWKRHPLPDYGAPLGMLALVILIPLAAFIIFLIQRKAKLSYSKNERIFLKASSMFLGMFWALVFLIHAVIFIIALNIFEPWPISLRQGPDTRYAKEIFKIQFGLTPPPSVSELYCQSEWLGWGDGNSTKCKFSTRDGDVINKIIAHQYLEPINEDEIVKEWKAVAGHKWWPKVQEVRINKAYGRKQTVWREGEGAYQEGVMVPYLWVDEEDGMIYFWQ